MDDSLTTTDLAEVIALHRAQVIGPLAARALEPGALQPALRELSAVRFRAPRSHGTCTYSVATLERWLSRFRSGGLDALRPKPRSDRGRGRELTEAQKTLLLDVRKEQPNASTALILRTLVADGRVQAGELSATTLRRFFAEHGLDPNALRTATKDARHRLRWQAERPGALWHGDVCHGSAITVGGASRTVRVHAFLDDASRYVVALEARYTERETDMLALLVRALRRFGPPDVLYLDNGSTYRGEALSLACARIGTALVHAQPYDAPARGKMERFWRTLRTQCLDFCAGVTSLHDLNVRLFAWLDESYHRTPHGGLFGKTPADVWDAAALEAGDFDESQLRAALTVRARRRVRRDNTLAFDGIDWETSLHFFAGKLVTVAHSLAEPDRAPWIEHEGKQHPLVVVDPIKNAKRTRSPVCLDTVHPARVSFDPPKALLDQALGRATATLAKRGAK